MDFLSRSIRSNTSPIHTLEMSDMVDYNGTMNSSVCRMKNACVLFSRIIPFTSELSLDIEDRVWNETIADPNTHRWDANVYIIYECVRKRLHLPKYKPQFQPGPLGHVARDRSGGNNFHDICKRWHAATMEIYHHIFYMPTATSMCINARMYCADPLENDVEGMGFLPQDERFDRLANKITFSIEDEVYVMVSVDTLCLANEPTSRRRLDLGHVLEYLVDDGSTIMTVDTQPIKV